MTSDRAALCNVSASPLLGQLCTFCEEPITQETPPHFLQHFPGMRGGGSAYKKTPRPPLRSKRALPSQIKTMEDPEPKRLNDYIPAYSPRGFSWSSLGNNPIKWIPQPSSGLICFLSGLCTTLLLIVIILIVAMTREGVKETEKNMEEKLKDMNLGVNSKLGELSAGDSNMLEKVVAMETSLKTLSDSEMPSKVEEIQSLVQKILSEEIIGYLSSEIQRIMGVVGKLAEELRHGNGSTDPLCERGWTHYGSKCYFLSQRLRPWKTAKGDCEGKKAQLVVINSKDEMDFLSDLVHEQSMWIGLSSEEDNWKWVDGTSYSVTPKFWAEGEPDRWHMILWHGDITSCATLRSDGWSSSICSNGLQYICERERKH